MHADQVYDDVADSSSVSTHAELPPVLTSTENMSSDASVSELEAASGCATRSYDDPSTSIRAHHTAYPWELSGVQR